MQAFVVTGNQSLALHVFSHTKLTREKTNKPGLGYRSCVLSFPNRLCNICQFRFLLSKTRLNVLKDTIIMVDLTRTYLGALGRLDDCTRMIKSSELLPIPFIHTIQTLKKRRKKKKREKGGGLGVGVGVRKREGMRVCVRERERERGVGERERESKRVCMLLCVCARAPVREVHARAPTRWRRGLPYYLLVKR